MTATEKHALEVTLCMAVRTMGGREYLDTTCTGSTPEAVQRAAFLAAERYPEIEQEFPFVRVARVQIKEKQ